MKTLFDQLNDFSDSTSIFAHKTHPYYIVTPEYSDKSAGIRLLHQLCSLLNKLGYESYVTSQSTNGQLWSPILTEPTKTAHYLAKRKPIVIYPEIIKGTPLNIGLPVRYALYFPGRYGNGEKTYPKNQIVYKHRDLLYPDGKELHLPIVDLELFHPPENDSDRELTLVYYNRYTGPIHDHGPNVIEISSKRPVPHSDTADLYRRAKVMYAYEGATATIEARLCGCPVILVPNEQKLPAFDDDQKYYGTSGLGWGLTEDALKHAKETVKDYPQEYLRTVSRWREQLQSFINETQAAADALTIDEAWPITTVDSLNGVYSDPADRAARADRIKWQRVHEQYQKWIQRSTLREIDAQIYAEHWASGNIEPLHVVVDHRNADDQALADTFDSLSQCLGQPSAVTIIANTAEPIIFQGAEGISWVNLSSDNGKHFDEFPLQAKWILLVRSGTTLSPNALVEWGLFALNNTSAKLIYADEDLKQHNNTEYYPFFKPDCNIELMRSMNYLGNAVAIKTETWNTYHRPLIGAQIYATALSLIQDLGVSAIGHVDTILSHSGDPITTTSESEEFDFAREALTRTGLLKNLIPTERWGTWRPHYKTPDNISVSLLIPSGHQTGYLRSLLQSLKNFPEQSIQQIVIVCQHSQYEETTEAASVGLNTTINIITIPDTDIYSHAAALNAAASAATGEVLAVADDDVEFIHDGWLTPLLGYLSQPDVACVAPRLLLPDPGNPRVCGGPVFLGIGESAQAYCGEHGLLHEVGIYSRLQLAQDVSAVAGHFFILRKSLWEEVGGLNETRYSLFHPILDLCLRLSNMGYRHVWTPLTNIAHHGGKTINLLRKNNEQLLKLADQEILERKHLIQDWATELANDRNYNRHLSLRSPFDIEQDIVVDWNPKRKDRCRILSTALFSGAGQYRVIEPLNGLQDEGLAQTCVVLPTSAQRLRVLSPIEVRRAAPDVLVLQHSVDDGTLEQLNNYKLANPTVRIVQMVDDLFGDVPLLHPGRSFQSREGHQRMIRAIKASDHLVVTTKPLKEHYSKYVKDVSVIPNTLDRKWFKNLQAPPTRKKLRVGWVGAGQHAGDQKLVAEVIKETADRYDWVFMGMAIDEIKPHLKEFHTFVSIDEYPSKMRSLDLDIAIAPLENNLFNTCKSNLRLLEYGAMGWPVICSKVYPYTDNNPPVIHCSDDKQEWIDALKYLEEDKERRWRKACALHRWVRDNYVLEDEILHWFKVLTTNQE